MYTIRGADQKEYGPVTSEVLVQWIVEGRVTPQTPLQRAGTPHWRPAAQYPEFQGAFAKAQPMSQTGGPPGIPNTKKAARGLSISSFVMGIISVVPPLGFITSIPAVITGHLARRRIRKSPAEYGGSGMALTGTITGYIGLFLSLTIVAAAYMLPIIAQRQSFQRRFYNSCQGNLRQLWMASQIYAYGHGKELPPDFESMKGDLTSPAALVCPDDKSKSAVTNWADLTTQNISYEYFRTNATLDQLASNMVVFRCPVHGNSIQANGRFVSRRRTKEKPPLSPTTNALPAP